MLFNLQDFNFKNSHLEQIAENYRTYGYIHLITRNSLLQSVSGLAWPNVEMVNAFTEQLKARKPDNVHSFVYSLLQSKNGFGILSDIFLNIAGTNASSVMTASEKFYYLIVGEFIYSKDPNRRSELVSFMRKIDVQNNFNTLTHVDDVLATVFKAFISSYVLALLRYTPFARMIAEQYEKEGIRQRKIIEEAEKKTVQIVEEIKEKQQELIELQEKGQEASQGDTPVKEEEIKTVIAEKEVELETQQEIISIVSAKDKSNIKNLLILGSALAFLL